MRSIAFLLLACIAVPELGAKDLVEKSRRDEIVRMSDDDPAMAQAFRKAKATLDQFLKIAASPPPNATSFAVKIAISDDKETEYFWILPFTRTGESFKGKLNNTPHLVRHVSEGQEIQFKKSEIVDWTYVDRSARRTYGNFTACALLTQEAPEEAAKFRKHYGLECDL